MRKSGAWLAFYKRSLSLALLAMFVASFLLHAATGSRVFNEEQMAAGSTDHVSTWGYLLRSQLWFESLQNWQSEFLAVASIVVLTIWLRQHGSTRVQASACCTRLHRQRLRLPRRAP